MSSPNLNVIIGVGCIVLCVYCVMYGADYFLVCNMHVATSLCQARAWLLSCSVTMVIGPMFAKSWRTHRIFRKTSAKRVVIKDDRLMLLVIGLLGIDVIVMSLWQGLDPIQSDVGLVLIGIPTHDSVNIYQRECTSAYMPLWIAAIFIYKAVTLLWGLYLSWGIRSVLLPSMNDSLCIIITVFATFTLASIAGTTSCLLRKWPQAVGASVIGATWLCTMLAECMVFIPKIFLWRKDSDMKVNMTLSTLMIRSRVQSPDQMEEELYHLMADNCALKKAMNEKNTMIQTLQSHLDSAQDKLTQLTVDSNFRQDSGLDVDLSSLSTQDGEIMNDAMQKLTTDDVSPQYRHVARPSVPPPYRPMANTPDSPGRPMAGASGSPARPTARPLCRRASVKSCQSEVSTSHWHKISRLRDSIAGDIHHAHVVSTNIRTVILNDMHRRASWASERSRQDVAGSIAQSYDLENFDEFSYVNNFLASPLSFAATEPNFDFKKHYSSAESINTLENDRFYPNTMEKRKHRLRKKAKRIHWKRDPVKKVYTIQDTKEPTVVQACVARNRSLSVDTFV